MAGGVFVMYNNTWKQHRRWFQDTLITRNTLDRYLLLQRREVKILLSDVLADPSKYRDHFKW